MGIASRVGRMGRRMLAGLTIALVTTGMLNAVTRTAEANPFCLVKNLTTSVQGSDLQQAIDDANSGDTLTVKGVCFGNFTVDGKTLRFRGVRTPARRYPTLDGANAGTVMNVEGGAQVTIEDLLITHGATPGSAGGILVRGADVTLDGSTRVVRNAADNSGGGIYVDFGTLTLNGSARVNLNTSGVGGGAGVALAASQMTMKDHARVNNNVASVVGGGIWVEGTTASLTMNDASKVIGNSATDGGGIYIDGGTVSGATAGGNVRNNTPNDIAP